MNNARLDVKKRPIQLQDLLKPRGGRLPNTWPWSSLSIGRSRSVDDVGSHLTCYTTLGEVGKCSTLKLCYPSLYIDDNDVNNNNVNGSNSRTDTHNENSNNNNVDGELQNSELANTLKDISGPCDLPYFNKFRMEPDVSDALICCPNRLSSSNNHQQRPSATTISTTPKSINSKPIKVIPDAVAALVYKSSKRSCGLLNNSLVGTEEHENERRFPWIVALIGKQGHFCSGTLIDKYHVVTAAQCVNFLKSEDVANLRVYLGDYKLNTISDGPLISRRISRIIYHRYFNDQTLKNDVALLKLNLPAPIGTPKVEPICLPKNTKNHRQRFDSNDNFYKNLENLNDDDDELDELSKENTNVILAGWGRSWIHSPTPILRKSSMKIWSNEECRKKYGYLARSGGILESMLCASSVPTSSISTESPNPSHLSSSSPSSVHKGNNNSSKINEGRLEAAVIPSVIIAPATAFNEDVHDCIGDSGSPLMRLRKDTNTYELIGITSWNIGCGNYPYVYSRVSKFISWIDKNRRRF